MKKNIGRLDQVLRIGISLVLIYVALINPDMVPDQLSSWIIGGIGFASLFFAIVRSCPLYSLAGINTCSREERE